MTNVYTVSKPHELFMLRHIAQMYGVESSDYTQYFAFLEATYDDVIQINLNKKSIETDEKQ